jgi:hypothetical protein
MVPVNWVSNSVMKNVEAVGICWARMSATEAGLLASAGMELTRPDERVTTKNVCWRGERGWDRVDTEDTHNDQEDEVSGGQVDLDGCLARNALEGQQLWNQDQDLSPLMGLPSGPTCHSRRRTMGRSKLRTASRIGGRTPLTTPCRIFFPIDDPPSQAIHEYFSVNVVTFDRAPMNATVRVSNESSSHDLSAPDAGDPRTGESPEYDESNGDGDGCGLPDARLVSVEG